jgi:hypothetical protein
MIRIHAAFWSSVLLLCLVGSPARAQESQLLPEVDAHLTINSTFRGYLQAKDDREGCEPTQVTFGPSIQLFLKPLLKLKEVKTFDLDDSKSRFLVMETGYRFIAVPDAPSGTRLVETATSNFPLKAGFFLSDRNRFDLDWKNNAFSWRYRNKLTLERTFAIGSYHLIPYLAAEPFYESQYSKWSTTSLYIGSLFPVGNHVQFNLYFEHDNNTGRHPNQQINSVGLVLNLYFSLARK